MKSIIVAPVSDNIDALYIGIREFPTEKVILVASPDNMNRAREVEKDLKKFKIHSTIIEIKGQNIWEETFRVIAEIKKTTDKNIMINVATGDSATKCAAISAAFVNGLKAFDVAKNEIMLLPVMKFSYYKLIPEKKLEIITLLHNEKDCCTSFEDLSKRLKMSLPLVSYHINGNMKSEGLKQMGLVETKESKRRLQVSLTTLGKLIIKGYI
jgi:DNA-binding transcriptional ArsR family regulator